MSKAKSKDIREAIKAFIHHVESLENPQNAEDPEENGFEAEYKLIQEAQARNRRDNVFSMDVGKAEDNMKKNRYKDILPYDDHRVTLRVVDGEQDSDYINASKLMGVKGSGGYIATQGPLSLTVNDFWRMIWEYNVEIIFMACRIVEMGKIKCKQYWNDVDKLDEFGDITVFTEAEDKIMSDCVRRNFRVMRGEEVRHVIQFHYSGWPDHGIPDDAGHIRDMIGFMRQTRHNHQAPLLVHCSAGCGRTGAIIAIDYVWTLLEEGMFDGKFNLFDLICDFREQRMSIVQTADQYALVNKVLKSLCEEWLSKMSSHTYENVVIEQASEVSEDITTTSRELGRDLWHLAQHGQTAKAATDVPTAFPFSITSSESLHSAVNGLQATVHSSQLQASQHTSNSAVYSHLNKPGPISPPADAAYDTLSKSGPMSPAPDKPLCYSTGNKKAFKAPVPPAASLTLKSPPDVLTYSVAKIIPPADATVYSHLNKSGPISPPANAAYDTLNGSGLVSRTADTSVYSTGNQKAVTAPTPPIQSLKPQSDEPIYTTVNKTSCLKSPDGVGPSPPPKKFSLSDEGSAYNTISEVSGESVSTAYEVIEFPMGPGNRSLSTSSWEASRGRIPSTSTTIQNSRQLNLRNLPGFSERLPRVRGPIPMPQTWNKA